MTVQDLEHPSRRERRLTVAPPRPGATNVILEAGDELF